MTYEMAPVLLSSAGLLLCAALYTDLLSGRIPNGLTLSFAGIGLCLNIMLSGLPAGIWIWGAGIGTGLCIFMIPYAQGGTGGGDVKLLGAMGAILGPLALIWVFLYAALFCGLYALIRSRHRRTFAFTGPLVLGFIVYGCLGGLA